MRASTRLTSKRALVAFVSLALLLGMVSFPVGTISGTAIADDLSSTDEGQQISDLLAAGDYEQNQVVAAVYGSADDATGWLGTDGCTTETLLETTSDVYASATDESITNAGVDASVGEGDAVTVLLVRDPSKSTEDLLRSLWNDTHVLSVEPNYVTQVSTPTDAEQTAEVQGATEAMARSAASGIASSGDATAISSSSSSLVSTLASSSDVGLSVASGSSSEIADLTGYQWGLNNDGSTFHDGRTYVGFDINSPGWNTEEDNACGVVAVMDTGIDVTNPDLEDVVMKGMDAYNPAGGENGINITGDGAVTDITDTLGHGTFVSGIIAAKWNGFGTSGVANGVRLVGVKAANSTGEVSIADMAKGYEYLSVAMDNGLNLVAVNNSWGDREMPKMLSIVVTKLGEKGVVSVFSSGNLGIDSDYNSTSPSVLKDNPYAIVVDGSNKNGENVYNYGVSTTDVVAPGVNILTTASSTAGGADYLAEADKSPLASDHFDDTATDTVRAYKVCDEQTLAVNAADRVGSTDTAYYYESGNSLGIGHGDLATFDDGSQGTYLKIPVTSEPSSFLFDYKLEQHYLSSPEFSSGGELDYIAVENDENEVAWMVLPCSTFGGAGERWSSRSSSTETLLDSGWKVVYDSNGCATVRVEVMANDSSGASNLKGISIDCLAVGTKTTPYMYGGGTSAAAPMVTGAVAVAAKAQGITEQPEASERGRLARERVEWIKSHVNQYDGQFLGICSTGGQIDLSVGGSPASSTLPVMSTAYVTQGSDSTCVTIEGSNFGDTAGTVTIAKQDASVVSWSDGRIVVRVPDGLCAGVLAVSVTARGKTVTEGFALEIPSAGNVALFEKDITLPKAISETSMDNPLVGIDDRLFVFPQDQYKAAYQYTDTETSYEYGTFKTLWRYDADSDAWTPCADLPQQLNTLSATAWDGSIVVCGTIIDWDAKTLESVLYVYDPTADAWQVKDASAVPYAASIVDADGRLVLVGGSSGMDERQQLVALTQDNIATLDVSTGAVVPVGTLANTCLVPQVTAVGSTIYVAQDQAFSRGMTVTRSGMQALTEEGGAYVASDISDALPRVNSTKSDGIHGRYGLTSTSYEVIISGALAYADDTETSFLDADTFVSSSTGSTFTVFGKRAARGPLHYARSAVTGGWLYTMGSSIYDDDILVLRATRLESPSPTPEPEPEPEPVSDTTDGTGAETLPATGDQSLWSQLVDLLIGA